MSEKILNLPEAVVYSLGNGEYDVKFASQFEVTGFYNDPVGVMRDPESKEATFDARELDGWVVHLRMRTR